MQVCTLLQTDNHANTSPLSFLQAGCPSCRPTNSVKALKAENQKVMKEKTKIRRTVTVARLEVGEVSAEMMTVGRLAVDCSR